MANNENLLKAWKAKNDEFYTLFDDVKAECDFYAEFFENKTIFCPCDDVRWSNFARYFALNFARFKLKSLICSCWYPQQLDLFGEMKFKRGYWAEYRGECPPEIWLRNPRENYFKRGNGDFRYPEPTALLARADVVVTNPPFSLWREFYAWIKKSGKSFLIIGHLAGVKYMQVFDDLKNDKVSLGIFCSYKKMRFRNFENKILDFGNICWFTDFKNSAQRKKKLKKNIEYTPARFPKFDNFDGINVNRIKDFPKNYNGTICVPITIFDYDYQKEFKVTGHSADLLLKGVNVFDRVFLSKFDSPPTTC